MREVFYQLVLDVAVALEAKKNIVIAGYPKSGTTWVTRLVAEMLGCPVVGFWGHDGDTMASEGSDRESHFACYQSHHLYQDLPQKEKIDTLILVIRHPGDILLSGAAHFRFGFKQVENIYKKLGLGTSLHWHALGLINLLLTKRYRRHRMLNALLHGDQTVSTWCRHSWKQHIASFSKSADLMVSYEDLLDKPLNSCERILNLLEFPLHESNIISAIERQSFVVKKAGFQQKADRQQVLFLRKGKSGEWKKELSTKQLELLDGLDQSYSMLSASQ